MRASKNHRQPTNETNITIPYLMGLVSIDASKLKETLPRDLRERKIFCATAEQNGEAVPFDPHMKSIVEPGRVERISLQDAINVLEAGGADGVGIVLRAEDGLCAVRLTVRGQLGAECLPACVEEIIRKLGTYTEFGRDGRSVTVICRAVKPDDFLHQGVLEDGTVLEVRDRDCFVSVTGAVLHAVENIADRQVEIEDICERYVERRCPIAGKDGMLAAILPALFTYRDRREELEAKWKTLVAKNRRRRERLTMPPEFVAAVEMLGHLMGADR